MPKLERRYENGTLRISDIERWGSENFPEVYRIIRKFWKVDVEPPKIKGMCSPTGTINDFKKSYVPIEVNDVKLFKRFFERAGRKTSGDYLLRTIAGGRFSTYILYCLNPENLNFGFSFREPSYDLEDFYNCVSINSQVRAISEIGSRTIERSLGIYDPIILQNAIKNYFEEVKGKPCSITSLKKIQRAIKFSQSERVKSMVPQKKIEKRLEEDRKMKMENLLDIALLGTSMRFTADYLEKEYKDIFHQLIRKTLKPEKTYVNQFIKFVTDYMLTFKMRLIREFPPLRD
jgi:hypothetical protein